MLIGPRQQAELGGGPAFCQAPQTTVQLSWGLVGTSGNYLWAFYLPWGASGGGGGAPFVLRYKKPLVMLFILEVPGVTDDTLTYRLVPKDSLVPSVLSGTVLSSRA